jgi:tetratricopeptide (TPR) repeat protein
MGFVHLVPLLLAATAGSPDLERARDQQDRATLERLARDLNAAAQRQPADAEAQYRAAVAQSYLAEVLIELRDKAQARPASEAGIRAAEQAVKLKPNTAEYHRILGTLCGQYIAGGNALLGLRYGRCAMDEINRAVELDPKSAAAYISRGVGNYYLPPQFGGSIESAIKDFEKAIQLDPRSAEAQLWLGLALRKANRIPESRKALEKSLALNPNRIWTKQQLEKTPAH